jgi:hypothetical protein
VGDLIEGGGKSRLRFAATHLFCRHLISLAAHSCLTQRRKDAKPMRRRNDELSAIG